MRSSITLLGALALLAAACSSGGDHVPTQFDAGRQRRKFDPPPGTVRALPPHPIDGDGVGPYRLRAGPERHPVTQADIIKILPTAVPRVALLDVEGVLDVSVVRTEDDQLLVGGRPNEPVSFVAALAPGIAHTQGGIGVGATRAELAALGEPVVDPRIARDPRIHVPGSLPNARFLLDDDDHVVAILLLDAGPSTSAEPPVDAGAPIDAGTSTPACTRRLPGTEPEVLAAAGVTRGAVSVHAACLGGVDAVVVANDVVTVVGGEGDRPHRIASLELRGLVWAAPIRADADRDEIVAITERRGATDRGLTLVALRVEGGRLVRVLEEKLYALTQTSAQWIGARLADLQLLVTVEARGDAYEVGGALIHSEGSTVRDVAPLVPMTVTRRRGTRPDTSGSGDAGVAPQDARSPDAGHRDAAPLDAQGT